MIVIQQEFQLFSSKYTLQQAYRLLNVAPSNYDERPLYYKYLDWLTTCPSDIAGANGHDRIVQARQQNLEGSAPLPMYNVTHQAADNPAVLVTQGQPVPHENQIYWIISTPTIPKT
jgi:hypothetical protein